MPITIVERKNSRTHRQINQAEVIDFVWLLKGSNDDRALRDFLQLNMPASFDGRVPGPAVIRPLGPDLWEATATYQPVQVQLPVFEIGDINDSFGFDQMAEMDHIDLSLETVHKRNSEGTTAADFGQLINATPNGVHGVDIYFPTYKFQESHELADATVTPAFKANIFNHQATVNSATFKGFSPGEVIFLGATGAKRGREQWNVTYHFAARKNRTNIVIPGVGGNITIPEKKGWHYLWAYYIDEDHASVNIKIKRPKIVFVERVYEETDLNDLFD
jgi:hypothetical protein